MSQIVRLLFIFSLSVQFAYAQPNQRELQRKLFLQAESELNKGNLTRFNLLKITLRDYPLLPYLEYQELNRNLSRLKNQQVNGFLDKYPDQPLASRLRKKWLNQLARTSRWRDYIAFYTADSSITRQCHYLNALIQTGQKKQAFSQVEPLWLDGKSRPKACDPVFAAWQKSDDFTSDLVWQRIALAMGSNQTGLAKYLGRFLDRPEKAWLNRWLDVHGDPLKARNKSLFTASHPYKEEMLAHAVSRLARTDPLDALDLWQTLQRQHQFGKLTTHLTDRRLSLAMMRSSEPDAYHFVTSVQPCGHDTRLQDTQLIAGLVQQDWKTLKQLFDQLPETQQQSERWRYWRARTLEQLGEQTAANTIYRELATQRSYYGFLAADRTQLPYMLSSVEAPTSLASRIRINLLPGIERTRELVALERWTSARREWHHASQSMSADDLMAAAKLAQSWGWHDQAIFTIARSSYWDDLTLRFPLEHEVEVARLAKTTQLDKAWIFAVIRQESAFNASVQSSAGAVGLMQLMPATARQVATRVLKQPAPRKSQLTDPGTNIELGATYLRQVFDQLEENPVLATAAYNAGPHRISRWMPDQQLAADIWIELIPFKETRKYVKRVLTYAAIYDKRLGRQPTRLSNRMPPIGGTEQQKASIASL